jgi:capsular exopolysaccharide synthesis family protein
VPREGKSVTTVNLGLVMAEGGEHNILIADADFRRTSLARMLGIKGAPGLAELVRGEAELSEVLQPTPCPNLKIIPAGTSAGKSYAELLSGPPARAILADFRALFHYTFLDTPPVTTVSDVSMLAPHCDGTIMVIEMRRTPEPTVQQAVRTLQTNNVKVLGCILSRHPDRPSRYYDRYYYNYYRND